ncbi:hypothetical protein HaLaN_21465, partial [Haematococcus lacustris]
MSELMQHWAHTPVPQPAADAGPWVGYLAAACCPGRGTPCPWRTPSSALLCLMRHCLAVCAHASEITVGDRRPLAAKDASSNATAVKGRTAHSVTADSIKKLRLPQIAILLGAGVATCSDYRSGPKLPHRVKIDALIRDRAVNNGTRPRRMANGQASPK